MIRSLHPADVKALFSFLGKAPVNEARTRYSLCDKQEGLITIIPLLKGYLFDRERQHVSVYIDCGIIRGLISIRSCSGPGAWEIDRLLMNPGNDDDCINLLEHSASIAGDIGAEKLFLRLNSDSVIADISKQSGFRHYLTEYCYCLDQMPDVHSPEMPLVARPKLSADEQRLFRLYNVAVPPKVRSAEGITFQGWLQSRDRNISKELVFEKTGEILGCLSIKLKGGIRQLNMVSTGEADIIDTLVKYSLALLEGKGTIYWHVPEFQQCLRDILEEQGFSHIAEYSCLAKQLSATVREPHLVPLQA
ncbi:hypothetical protein ACFLWV_01830 [Chloroflexota bacterium]